ncbi:capsular biosynthesis protein [Edwardsiella piscicida]|uniref:capsular biosynthesis protein n=1 Tax=Edwardsiella piscicida TaxID=1263550 RepID=UPI001CED7F71|nr:capsular biosynthesis protein [Edwardsiella piscicida]AOP43202.2 capsular biosynthesis protein [Edwardsiella piscicida]UCQ29823.1 capsular biosynthesis protein [Edwardsiella piscicida]UCQ56099.1 capsular biosynthesis protein [Edwardsiella piscicida]
MRLNTGTYLQAYLYITLIVCGTAQYFSGIGAILWIPFFMTLAIPVLMLLQNRTERLDLTLPERIILLLYLAFIALSTISTLLQGGLTVTLVGFKNELALSLIAVSLLLGFCRESQVYRLLRSLDWVFYAQFPLVIIQILFILPKRIALRGESEMWDAVVGTFGGDPMGGGNTAALGLFCLLIMLLKVSAYRHGVISLRSALLHVVLAFALCVVGEVKFVILLAPPLLLLVWVMPSYLRGMGRINLKSLLLILLGALLLVALAILVLASGYTAAFGGEQGRSALAIFFDSMGYIVDPHFIMPSGELGRLTTLFFWLQNNDLWGISSQLFGYGLNATNSGSSVSAGYLHTLFNLILDATSLSMLLWEVGIVGTLLFIGLIVAILAATWPRPLLSPTGLSDADRYLLSSAPALTIFAIGCLLSLPYSQILMIIPMLQCLFYLALGALLVIRRGVRHYREATND